MKTRLILLAIMLTAWVAIYRSLLHPVSVLVRQSAAVTSVDSSNQAYLTQQAVEVNANTPVLILGIAFLLVVFLLQPILNLFKPTS